MDKEDRRRYFIVGSVILEIVQPLFRTKLENDYRSNGIGSLQAFLTTLPVLHILFHLRHRNAYCCKDNLNCRNNSKLPLIYCQWDLLYTDNPGQPGHNCHCKFIANPVQLNDLDITLASLILLNCCHLGPSEENAVRKLRRYKNDYLSQNTEGEITETEYKSLWTDLTSFVLQLDPNKQDDLIRIENRSLDEGLCSRYSIDLLNIHKKLNEMGTQMQGISSGMQVMFPQIKGITSDIQELLSYHRSQATCQYCNKKLIEQGMDTRNMNPYKLGQDIFYLHHLINMNSILNEPIIGVVSDIVMMDDGRLVMCLLRRKRLLICNTDRAQVVQIPVEFQPCCLTPVNISVVAVYVYQFRISYNSIEMYDINNKCKLLSIPVSIMVNILGLKTIHDKLVVCLDNGLLMVNYQTYEIEGQKVETHCEPWGVETFGDRIFYIEFIQSKILYWYCLTDDKIHKLRLPAIPWSITALSDGSLYVMCMDDSVQHVSSTGIHFKTLKTNQSPDVSDCYNIQYNSKQKKMIALNTETGNVKIFHEI